MTTKEMSVKLRQTSVSLLRNIIGDANAYRLKRRLGYPAGAFHDDWIRQQIVNELISRFDVTAFVETGTYQGDTTRFVAVGYPRLPIHSVEVNEQFYEISRAKLRPYANVHLHFGSSEHVLCRLLNEGQLGRRPFFYLDAHWYDYWPLCDELRAISRSLDEAVIVIDDFDVPGRNDCSYDVYLGDLDSGGEQRCGLPLIRTSLDSNHTYHAIFPSYPPPPDVAKLAGYVVLLQNPDAGRLKALRESELVRSHFTEHSLEPDQHDRHGSGDQRQGDDPHLSGPAPDIVRTPE